MEIRFMNHTFENCTNRRIMRFSITKQNPRLLVADRRYVAALRANFSLSKNHQLNCSCCREAYTREARNAPAQSNSSS